MDAKIKVSRYAYGRFIIDLSALRLELDEIRILSRENPKEYGDDIQRLSLKIEEMGLLEKKFQVVDVKEGEKTLQIGYHVHLKNGSQIKEKTLDGYSYDKKVCSIESPIGKEIFNKKVGYQCGVLKIIKFFIQNEDELAVAR
ncbi:MAG: hypothetical protein ACOYMB_02690 [Patescibacteria group bacterium]